MRFHIVFVVLQLSLLLYGAHSAGDCFNCGCLQCAGIERFATYKLVTINALPCKGGPLSWVCCRGSDGTGGGCDYSSCIGVQDDSKPKCDSVSVITFKVPLDATTITVQLHDGKAAGTVDCSQNGGCCGGSQGSCGTASGVCSQTISLSTCPPIERVECTKNSDCPFNQAQPCGVAKCEANKCKIIATTDTSIVCRVAQSPCDLEETCNGVSTYCPPDTYKPVGAVCRPAADNCDVPERCVAGPGTPPSPPTVCPPDQRNDFAYSFKCGQQCYTCGYDFTGQIGTQNGGVTLIGGCNLGKCDSIQSLAWPQCLTAPISSTCPNGKRLSNLEFYRCAAIDDSFSYLCTTKLDGTDVIAGFVPPYNRYWDI